MFKNHIFYKISLVSFLCLSGCASDTAHQQDKTPKFLDYSEATGTIITYHVNGQPMVQNNTMNCPRLLVDDKADSLILKTPDLIHNRFKGHMMLSEPMCLEDKDFLNISFDINVNGLKDKGLPKAQNAVLPVDYYVSVYLVSGQETEQDYKKELSRGVYTLKLEDFSGKYLVGDDKKTIRLPLDGYNLAKSVIKVGFHKKEKDSSVLID